MKTFKIAKKTNEVVTTVPLDYQQIVTSGNGLCLIIKKDKAMELIPGGKIHFEKFASGNTGQMLKVCEEDADIKNVVDVGDTRYVYFEYVYIKPLTLASFSRITSGDGFRYKLYFTSGHHMLSNGNCRQNSLCDLTNMVFYVRRGGNVLEFSGLGACFPGEVVRGCSVENNDGYCCDDTQKLFNYETMERNSILAKTMRTVGGTTFNPEPGDTVLFATNPYFRTQTNGNIELYDCPGEIVNVCKYVDFMGLDVVLEQDYDAKRMFQEYQVNELFVKKIKSSIIPDFIDLEKVKYAPAFFEEVPNEETDDPDDTMITMYLATGLTFNLHFRTRISGQTKEGDEDIDPDILEEVMKYRFEDTWHFNDEMNTWNGNGLDTAYPNGGEKTRQELYLDEDFVNSSNLIGYLGFTDDDIYNQKNRVKQTFIRLSFYDDKNPLTQNLLCYSTIFLDGGDLFGKYVKRRAMIEESYDPDYEEYVQELDPVVWNPTADTDTCSAVTCQLIVNDEYDMTRSGEGFNLYLFREDAPIENEVQNIYMKVEFNHAGIGRTVPLIFWRKDKDGNAETLTMKNYLDNLYIPIEISLSDRGYVYSFPDAISAEDREHGGRCNGIVWENERLVLNLFEPMIEPEPEI